MLRHEPPDCITVHRLPAQTGLDMALSGEREDTHILVAVFRALQSGSVQSLDAGLNAISCYCIMLYYNITEQIPTLMKTGSCATQD